MLDPMTSTVHLKMKYHKSSGETVIITTNLYGSHLIHEMMLKNLIPPHPSPSRDQSRL